VAHVVERLPSKCEALSSSSNATKNNPPITNKQTKKGIDYFKTGFCNDIYVYVLSVWGNKRNVCKGMVTFSQAKPEIYFSKCKCSKFVSYL
jgi:hypothetical protein